MLIHLTGNKLSTDVRTGNRMVVKTDATVTSLPKGQILYFQPSAEFFRLGMEYSGYELGDPVKIYVWMRSNATITPGMLLGELFTIRVADPS
jgi:hypothetical protein